MRGGGPEIDQPRGAARRHLLVHAPFFDVPVLIDMGGGPDLIGIQHAAQQRQRQQRRAGQGRDHMQRGDRPGIGGQRRTGRRDRGLGLADMHDAFGENEMRAQRIGRPEQQRVPMRGLPRHQRLRMAGAIEQQIGLEIFRHVLGHGLDPVDHRIDDAVGKPRHRHGQGIDELLLRLPFRRDRVGDLPDRHHHLRGRKACGSACHPA